MFNTNKFCSPCPPADKPPAYTLTEEMHHTIRLMRDTLHNMNVFKERMCKSFEDYQKMLTDDNTTFKDVMNQSYVDFSNEIKSEVSGFIAQVEADLRFWKDGVETNYSELENAVNTAVANFKDSVNTTLEEFNTNHASSFADYQQKLETHLNMYEADLTSKFETLQTSINNDFQNLSENLTNIIVERLNNQDRRISDAEAYMKTNLGLSVATLLGDMRDSGKFEDIIENEVFPEIVQKLERIPYVNVKEYGAKGDGVTDDTTAIKNALASGSNVFIPEGEFVVNEPLYVNVNKVRFNGVSSKSVIKAGETFPDGKTIITFYSPDGDYYDRTSREGEHGNFTVIGKNRACDGVRFGGAVGSLYEGHVECNTFKHIMVKDCNVAFLWGAHAYRDLLVQCDSHANNYSLKTTADITDTGEVFTCLECGFWSGSMHIDGAGELVVIASTIHTTTDHDATVETRCAHYFRNVAVNFTNCHIEAIVRTDEARDELRGTQFMAQNALVNFNNCVAVITGEYITLDEDCKVFHVTSTDGRTSGIYVNGGEWKYYLNRIKLTGDNPVVATKGTVFNNVRLKNANDGARFPIIVVDEGVYRMPVVPVWGAFVYGEENEKFDHTFKISEANKNKYSIITGGANDGEYSGYSSFALEVTDYINNTEIMLMKRIPLNGEGTVILRGTLTSDNDSVSLTINSNKDALSILKFADANDRFIEWGAPFNSDKYTNGQTLEFDGTVFAIPHNAKYMYVGIALTRNGGFTANSYGVGSSLIYELI